MTNSQFHRTIDWVIGNLHFDLSVDYVPAPEIKEICILHIERHNDYDFCGQRTTIYIVVMLSNSKMIDMFTYLNKCKTSDAKFSKIANVCFRPIIDLNWFISRKSSG